VRRRFSRILAVGGTIGTIATGWTAARATVALARATPLVPVAVGEARDGQYVRLEGAVLDCETRALRDGDTFVLGADAAGGHPFLAHLLGEVRCKDIVLEGSFLPGRFTRAFIGERMRVRLPDGEDLRLFEEAPSPRWQRAELIRTAPWLALAVAALALGVRGLRRPR
jgi:hypothetical protein